MLHVRCGSDIVETLQRGGLPGEIIVWADPLSQGPTPALTGAGWYDTRAEFIAQAYDADQAATRIDLEAADAALMRCHTHEEVVLWFEHDLFDQSILVRLLARFATMQPAPRRLSLVTTDSHPDVARFTGLGNLNATQLIELFARRVPVTEAHLALGRHCWDAWTSPEPTALATLVDGESAALPYLPAAARRHLEELPWTGDGLSLTERLILTAAMGGADARQVFLRVNDAEPAPWLGDTMCHHVLRELARLRPALLEIEGSWSGSLADLRSRTVRTTRAGESVLAGTDRVQLTGIDIWVGGVRLLGSVAAWRWDPARRHPVPASST
jgi:hypothetical protein